MSLINSLPEDIIIDCISRVPRRYYPTLSLVSKYFRSLITSHELYARRALLERTEYCLYVTISNKSDNNDDGDDDDRLYTLRHNFNSPDKKYSLVPVSSLPMIPPRGSYVAVGSKIFVIPEDESLSSTDTLLIDCRFHTAHNLPSMPSQIGSSVYKYSSVGEICIGGYKVGSRMNSSDGVMFLNQIPQTSVCMYQWTYSSVMTSDSVSFKASENRSVYDQNKYKWYDNDCFLDGVSYFYDPRLRILRAVDIRRMNMYMKDVKGVPITDEDVNFSCTVIYGGKVVVFLQIDIGEKNEIWCAEIKVEKDQKGELCGRVEWCGCVLEGQ
ncbi:hypothetical protein Bca4012_085916 [Brassica carinata]